MKLPPHLLARLAPAFATLATLATGSAFAGLPATPIRESEQKQSQIQGETRGLAEILDAMLGEYERNNLAGDDAKAVRRVRESLGSLSNTEMRQVVDMLQRARAATDSDAAVKTVADAFTAQKQIVLAIQRILAEHLREQEAADISRQLHELADRQAANLRNGIELARVNNGVQPDTVGAIERAQLETQRAEQAAIADEMKMIRGKVARLAASPDHADSAKAFTDAAKQMEQVEPVATAAAEELQAGQIFKATGNEKASRDELRKIARQLAPREKGAEALRNAERELAEVIAEQRTLRDATALPRKETDLDKWLADKLAANDRNDALPQRLRNQPASELRKNPEIQSRFENERKEMDSQIRNLEDQQGKVADKTDALAQETAEMPNVANVLKDAVAKMQEARAEMQDANAAKAAQQQDAALAQLMAAQAELKRRADEAAARATQQKAPAQPNNPANNPANDAQMAEAMNQLAQAQQQIEKAQENLQEAAEQSGQPPAQNAAQVAQAAPAAPAAAKSAQGAVQQASASAAMRQAAQQLAQASKGVAQASSQIGAQASATTQQAMQQAGQQLSNAAAQATGGQNGAAQKSAQNASQSLAQAQAMMASQQAGLSPSRGGAPMPGPGQGQGKGTQPGQGRGQGQAPGKSSQASSGPSQGAETYTPGDPKAVEHGAREAALKKADFIGLPARERAAIQQSLREKYPQEYSAQVEQYLLNLANESAKK